MPLSRFAYDPWDLPAEQRRTTFVGREPILDRLLAAIREQEVRSTVQHHILTGPRGVSRTTLLLTLRDRLRQNPDISAKWFCVQLREEEYYIHKQRDLWQLVLQALADEEKVAEAQQIAKQAEDIRDDEKSSALLVDGLRSICQRHNRRLALLVGNFGQLFPTTAAGESKHRKPDSEYRAFRKRLSTETFLMLIATSVKLFQDIYAYDKGFFHFFSPLELPELTQDEVIEMLRRLGQADCNNQDFLARLEKSQVVIRTLSMLAGGNPRLITMLYHILAQREMNEPVQALSETVAGLTPMLRQELADMPRQQSKTLDALLRLNGVAAPADIAKSSRLPLNVVTTQLGRLKEARYVTLEGGGKGKKATYRIADQMFSVWYWMRYVPVSRRRIELFTEFLRAWFSLEERKRLFQERLERFHSYQSLGIAGMARKSLLDAEYYTASFDDRTERMRELERIADAYITTGDWPSAAGLLAELESTEVRSVRKFESLGYWVLGNRLIEKGDIERALRSYSEAFARDPKNTNARAHFGLCLVLSDRYAEAKEQFDQILQKSRLNTVLRSQVLFGRAAARFWLGDREAEVADYSAVVGLSGAPPDIVASALVNRGLAKHKLGDSEGEIADYTALMELKGVPAELVAKALSNRAVAKGQLGDRQGEMSDYTAAVMLDGAPVEQVADALISRGVAKGKHGDFQGAMTDYPAAVGLRGASPEQVAKALFRRGLTKGEQGDPHGAIKDYSATVKLEGAPIEQAASALLIRGLAKARVDDSQRAIADCTELVQVQNGPTEVVAMALVLRGFIHSKLGAQELALRDFNLSLETPKLPEDIGIQALFNWGVAHQRMGKLEDALSDFTRCSQSGSLPYAHIGLRSAVRLLLANERVDEALGWVRRFHELEPPDASLDTRLEARLDMIRIASRVASLEHTRRLVDALLETDPEELRARLRFLKPGLELARTNDESVLANLPEDERKMAREIARTLAEAARPPADSPTTGAGDMPSDPADRPLRTAGHDIPAPASPDGSPS